LRLNRFGAALSILTARAVVSSACGGDHNAGSGSANDRHVVGEGNLWRQADPEGQRFHGPDSQVGTAVKAFLQSTIGAGQNGLADNGYIPVPDQFKSRLSTAVNAIA
jgi:hypothetical protein